jgi:hypothetical protein
MLDMSTAWNQHFLWEIFFSYFSSPFKQVLPCKEKALPRKEQALPRKEQALPRREQALPRKEQALPLKEQALPHKEYEVLNSDIISSVWGQNIKASMHCYSSRWSSHFFRMIHFILDTHPSAESESLKLIFHSWNF